MPSSMCCPLGPSAHLSTGSSFHARRSTGLKTPVRLMKPARLVDVATSGAVVTRYGATASSRERSTRTRPNASCVLERPGRALAGLVRHRAPAARPRRARGAGARGGPPRGCPAGEVGVEAVPLAVARRARWRSGSSSICSPVSSAEWLRGLPAIGQAPALDRVGEQHARPVGDRVALGEGLEQRGEVVAAEVLHQRREIVVAHVGDRATGVRRCAVEEALAQRRAGEGEQRLVLLVGHRVDPRAQRLAVRLRELLLQPSAVLHLDDVPAGGGELRASTAGCGCRGRRGRATAG